MLCSSKIGPVAALRRMFLTERTSPLKIGLTAGGGFNEPQHLSYIVANWKEITTLPGISAAPSEMHKMSFGDN